jgi:hypothetical protein
MVRLQVQLTDAQHRTVRERARRLGVSVAEVIRRSIDRDLEAQAGQPSRRDLIARALGVAGRHVDREGKTDVAARHDDDLAEIVR